MQHHNISDENLKQFKAVEPAIKQALSNAVIKCIETDISFGNRPHITTNENGVDIYTIKHQLAIEAEGGGLFIEMDAELTINQKSLLDKTDNQLATMNLLSGRRSLNLSYEVFEENHSYLQVDEEGLKQTFSEMLGVGFTLGKLAQFSAPICSTENKNTKQFQFFCFVLDTLEGLLTDNSFAGNKILNQMQTLSIENTERAIADFKVLLNKISG